MMLKSELGKSLHPRCGKNRSDDRVTLRVAGMAGFVAMLAILVAVAGCSQGTDGSVQQPSRQQTSTPSTTQTDQASDGPEFNLYLINGSHSKELPGDGGSDGDFWAMYDEPQAGSNGMGGMLANASMGDSRVGKARATYVQGGTHIEIQVGDTSPSASGATSPSVTGTLSPSAQATIEAMQDLKTELAAMLQAAFSPGGINDFAGSATGGSGSSALDKTSSNQLRQAWLQALKDDPSLIADFLKLSQDALNGADANSDGM